MVGCETDRTDLVFLLSLAGCLSIHCPWRGSVGCVKFHFVIIPLFSPSNVSKRCFSKSSPLLSCKDLLLPGCCARAADQAASPPWRVFEELTRFLGSVSLRDGVNQGRT